MKTIDILYASVLGDELATISVIHDYFGIANLDSTKICIIYGVYQGLIKQKGISKQLIEQCFINNRLDELIHKKYTYHKSDSYTQFVENQIRIGDTFIKMDNVVNEFTILDDNYCPGCEREGYITNNNFQIIESMCIYGNCKKCQIGVCKHCGTYDACERDFVCRKCEL